MIAMVLAAGYGTRLRPLTDEKSKVALSLAGVPVIVRVVRMLRDAGLERIVVNLHHAPDTVRKALSDWKQDVLFSPEDEILGTGGALWGARELIAGERVLLVNGDCYYGNPDLESALLFHESRGSVATMVLIGMPPGGNYRGVEIDGYGRLLRIAGRPESGGAGAQTLHFPGIHILEPEFITGIDPGFSDINRERYPELILSGAPVFGWRTDFVWHDLGTPARYLSAAAELIGAEGMDGETVIAGEGCAVDPSAVLRGPLEIGSGCRIGRECLVEASVLGDDVVLCDGAVVRRSLLGDGVVVDPGIELERVVAVRTGGCQKVENWE